MGPSVNIGDSNMNEHDQKQFNGIQKRFVIRFIIAILIGFFFFYWAATFGKIAFIQPILLNPFLYVFSAITFGFGYAVLEYEIDWRNFLRSRSDCFT